MNLILISEKNKQTNKQNKQTKQEMKYLNYSNALWDCFGFLITQVGNIALLGNQPGLM